MGNEDNKIRSFFFAYTQINTGKLYMKLIKVLAWRRDGGKGIDVAKMSVSLQFLAMNINLI